MTGGPTSTSEHPTSDHTLDPKFLAGVKLLERTGAQSFRIAHSPEEDGDPTIWYATATWMRFGGIGGAAEAAAALHPVTAVMRLCDQVITGGHCAHCDRDTIFDDNPSDTPIDALLDAMGCVYAWDPELQVFRRGCEGSNR